MVIVDDGIRLHAELAWPDHRDGEVPLFILLHGFTGHMDEPHLTALMEAVRGIGFAVLRAELYGHGQSDGAFKDHNLFKWLNNTMAVIDYARGLPGISDIYLSGHSQGGLTVILAAAMKADVIAGLIPLSPAVMIPEAARHGELLGVRFDPGHVPDELVLDEETVLGGNYIRVAQTIWPEQIAPRYQGPVLIVHGEADETVPIQVAVDAAALYRHAELVRIPGDTHCFDFHADEMTAAVTEWLKKQRN